MARMTSSYWIVVFTTVLAIFFSTTSATVVRLRHVDQETRKIQKSVNAGKTKSGNDIPSCDNFDASKVKLVTFDVFAALMDLTSKCLVPSYLSQQIPANNSPFQQLL